MAKTILIAGYGPGISTAMAETFGAAGFQVALVARSADKLTAGVAALESKGVKAAAFPADLSDPTAVRAVVEKVRSALGPISALEWTAYGSGGNGGDLLTADDASVRAVFDVAIGGLVAAVQAALPDLKREKGSIIVVNGGLGLAQPEVDAMGVTWGAMGLSVANAAKHKLVGLLAEKLRGDDVYVCELMILGAIKGTPFDTGAAPSIDGRVVADKAWELHTARKDLRATIR